MTVEEFLQRAAPLLLADEARHNLMLGIAGTVRDRPDAYPDAAFWVVDGAAALRTRPYNVVVARPRDEAALRALVDAIDDDLPGVSSPAPEAFDFARLWGRPYRVVQEHNVFALREVSAPRGVAGAWREATRDDLERIFTWWRAFVDEAIPEDDQGPAGDLAQIERRLDSDVAGFGLWEVDGDVVSLCGYGGRTPHGIRIGPVYTPPELRGHGYASALTAEVSQHLLDTGREFCFLYTDRANATANAIYERIGYRKVCEAAALAFE